MNRKGQGTFEYILLLAGILLIVVLAIVLLRGGIFQSSQSNIQRDSCLSALVQSSLCYTTGGAWNTVGGVLTGNVPVCDVVRLPGVIACDAAAQVGANNGTHYCCGSRPS